MIIIILILPNSQELIQGLVLVGVRIQVSKYDVSYGISMSFS